MVIMIQESSLIPVHDQGYPGQHLSSDASEVAAKIVASSVTKGENQRKKRTIFI